MMSNLPAGLPGGEMPRAVNATGPASGAPAGASAARVSGPGASGTDSAAADSADTGGQAQTFAEVLAGEDPRAELLAAMALANLPEPEPGPVEATDPDVLLAFLPGLEAGNPLPPGGGTLPAPPWNPGLAEGAAGDETTSLARLLGMVRALHGAGSAVPGEAEGTGQPRLPFPGIELGEMGRPAQASASTPTSAALTAPLAAAPTAAATAPVPPSLPIAVAPGRPDWNEAVGQRVLWMVSNGRQVAELRLNPPELGPVEVRVRADDDGLRLSFTAANGAVREALESAAPRLREMLQAEGLRLENMDIGQRHAGAGQRNEAEARMEGDGRNGDAGDAEAGGAPVASRERVGLVDLFV